MASHRSSKKGRYFYAESILRIGEDCLSLTLSPYQSVLIGEHHRYKEDNECLLLHI